MMCCLARLSLFCSAPFWVSRKATRASSSWMVSSMSLSFVPLDPGWRRRISLVDILTQGHHVEHTHVSLNLLRQLLCQINDEKDLRSFCSCVRACCLRTLFSSCSLTHKSSRCSLGSRNRLWGSVGRTDRWALVNALAGNVSVFMHLIKCRSWNLKKMFWFYFLPSSDASSRLSHHAEDLGHTHWTNKRNFTLFPSQFPATTPPPTEWIHENYTCIRVFTQTWNSRHQPPSHQAHVSNWEIPGSLIHQQRHHTSPVNNTSCQATVADIYTLSHLWSPSEIQNEMFTPCLRYRKIWNILLMVDNFVPKLVHNNKQCGVPQPKQVASIFLTLVCYWSAGILLLIEQIEVSWLYNVHSCVSLHECLRPALGWYQI